MLNMEWFKQKTAAIIEQGDSLEYDRVRTKEKVDRCRQNQEENPCEYNQHELETARQRLYIIEDMEKEFYNKYLKPLADESDNW